MYWFSKSSIEYKLSFRQVIVFFYAPDKNDYACLQMFCIFKLRK